jgi:RimJ/RimL family protein N-acetyltransferase
MPQKCIQRVTGEPWGFTLTQADEVTQSIEEQGKFLETTKSHPCALAMVVICDSRVVGFLDFGPGRRKRNAHTGEFGISLDHSLRDQGIGQAMMEAFLDWARANPGVEIVHLRVSANNPRAIHIYKKLGFVEVGYLKREVKLGPGQYIDTVWMSLPVKPA